MTNKTAEDAYKALAKIATIGASGNSFYCDTIGDALDDAVAVAQGFFRRHRLKATDYISEKEKLTYNEPM